MPYFGASSENAVRRRFTYLASASATSISGADANGQVLAFQDGSYVDVYLNGVKLKTGEDYDTATANTINNLSALNLNDEVEIIVYELFNVADTVSKTDGGTFNSAISVTGNVTSTGNLIINDGGNIGSTSDTDAISISSTGDVTLTQDLKIKDGGTIGSASDADAISIASTGDVTLTQNLKVKDGGTIGSASATDAMTVASTGIVTFKDDIVLKDAATIGVASSTSAISIASTGIVTFVDDIIIKDSGTIGSATIPTAIEITNTGEVTINNSTSGTASAPFVIRRDNNSNGNGVALVYELGDSGSATAGHGYARIFGTIEDSTNGAEDGALRFDTSNSGTLAQRLNIASDGTLTGSDTDGIGSLSDSRIKESVSDYTYNLSTFKQFTPKTFDWKYPSAHLNKSSDRGFLAQEVNAIDSSLIYKTPIDDEHPDASLITADSDGIKRPYASKLAGKDAMYVSVIKQLITKIETLEAKVAKLEEE